LPLWFYSSKFLLARQASRTKLLEPLQLILPRISGRILPTFLRAIFVTAPAAKNTRLTPPTLSSKRTSTGPTRNSTSDENGVKWRVKLGVEARPEVVATRLVWAVGYYANEDYFVPELRVEGMPHLKRGQNLVSKDGTVHNVRLKRSLKGEEKIRDWKWSDNPFTRQRQLNGLRVMMALLNNWDLKDENNAVYEEKHGDSGSPELHYAVSDLGASFGTTGPSLTHSMSMGNLKAYQHSKFIRKTTSEYVDFYVPSRPALIYLATPKEFFSRVDMRWIGSHIPRSDAQWIGGLLAQLSPDQIRDAFRAAGYTPDQVNAYAAVVEGRIAELNRL